MTRAHATFYWRCLACGQHIMRSRRDTLRSAEWKVEIHEFVHHRIPFAECGLGVR